jgi:DNA-binding MarR family transcriptional regulator
VDVLYEESKIDIQKFIDTFERLAKAKWRNQPSLALKSSEVRTLLCIKSLSHEENHAVTVSEISKRMFVTSPTVTQIIKNLNENGYIKRLIDPKDKRFVDISLTDKGEEIVQKVTDYLNVLFSGLIEKLGEDNCGMLIELLDQVCKYLDETNIEIQ